MSRMADLDWALRQWLTERATASPERIVQLSDELVSTFIPDADVFARMFGDGDDKPPMPPHLCPHCGIGPLADWERELHGHWCASQGRGK